MFPTLFFFLFMDHNSSKWILNVFGQLNPLEQITKLTFSTVQEYPFLWHGRLVLSTPLLQLIWNPAWAAEAFSIPSAYKGRHCGQELTDSARGFLPSGKSCKRLSECTLSFLFIWHPQERHQGVLPAG